MDAVSYSHSAKQAKRIESFIENPDSTSGIVTTPKVIEAGETVTIPAGRMAVLPNLQIDGTLNIEGDVFIPSGATMSKVVEKVTSTDNAVVRFNGTTGDVQNSGVIIDDNNNIITKGSTGGSGLFITKSDNSNTLSAFGDKAQIVGGIKNTTTCIYSATGVPIAINMGSTEVARIDTSGNVGIGTNNPVTKLSVNNSAIGSEAIRIGNSVGGNGSVQGSTYIGLNHWDVADSLFSSALIGVVEDGTSSYNASMTFSTRGSGIDSLATERMRLGANGNLLVGDTIDNGAHSLQVYGGISTARASYLLTSSNEFNFANTSSATSIYMNYNSSSAVISEYRFYNGKGTGVYSALLASAFNVSSDYRIKSNIKNLDSSIDSINKLRPVSYIKDGVEGIEYGLIAHEVEEVYEDLVQGTKDALDKNGNIDPQTVNYTGLIPILIKAIQELSEEIKILKTKVGE